MSAFKNGGSKIEQQKTILNRAKKKMMEYEKAGGSSTEEMDLYEVLSEEEQLVLAENMSRMEMKQTKCDSELYCATMKKLIFKTIPFYDANSNIQMFIPYHFDTLLRTSFPTGASGRAAKRLAKEIASLHNSLPISTNSSIFVRACEERLDVMKVLIIGPADTPYANGCFEFDVFFPSNYPHEPMRINFETTGNKTVRFNPNLYEDGKVCLSILNTWPGNPSERWDPFKSSLLQVLVSIQALVFVEEPFYNEPGYERMRNTSKGERQSCEYNAKIRQFCLQWAMLRQLQIPPKAFADVIECHFWLKGEEICAQVEEWIEDCERLAKAGKVFNSDLRKLKIFYEKLKSKFSSMKCPSALQQIISLDNKENNVKKMNKAKDDKYDEFTDEAICNCSIL